jgi:hypothetical protein
MIKAKLQKRVSDPTKVGCSCVARGVSKFETSMFVDNDRSNTVGFSSLVSYFLKLLADPLNDTPDAFKREYLDPTFVLRFDVGADGVDGFS